MVFFKHCYWPEAHKWGVLGLPKNQGAAKALREYRKGDLVLVAQTKCTEGEYSGKVFGICTLLGITGNTKELANPDVLKISDTQTWRECLVIDKYWHIAPIEYDIFGDTLGEQAKHHQGKLFRITDDEAVKNWLSNTKRDEEAAVYRAPRTLEHLQRLRTE
jgi:hypothetical protein